MILSSTTSESSPEDRVQPGGFRRYAIAVLCAAAGILAGVYLPRSVFAMALLSVFVIAVAISAALAGPAASLLTAVLESIGFLYLLIPRYGHLPLYTEVVLLGGLAATSLVIAALTLKHQRRESEIWNEVDLRERECTDMAVATSQLRAATETAERRARNAISDREHLRERLRASENRLALAAESSRFVIFEWDLAERIEISGDLKHVFGIHHHEWQGYATFLAAVAPQDRDFVQVQMSSAVDGISDLELECRVVWPENDVHWISVKGRFLSGASGKGPRMVGIFQEITQRKSSEEALVRQEKLAAAGRLAATIAHEINNPLAAVTNLVYIVKGDPTLSDAGRKYVELAQEELTRAAEIAKQTLGFYKENSEPVRFNVTDVVEEVLSVYVRRLPAHIKLEKSLAHRVEISALKGEVRQVISNLLSNAVYALEKGGVLKLTVRPEQQPHRDGALIQVSDDGPGISPEHLEHLFEPFFTTRKEIGTGLGLWVAQQIVQKHGGSIHVESHTDPERHGTCFSVFLPATVRHSEDCGAAA